MLRSLLNNFTLLSETICNFMISVHGICLIRTFLLLIGSLSFEKFTLLKNLYTLACFVLIPFYTLKTVRNVLKMNFYCTELCDNMMVLQS